MAIDWDAPLEEGKYFLPKQVITLYGTTYWDELTEEQRIALSREELANVLSVGTAGSTGPTNLVAAKDAGATAAVLVIASGPPAALRLAEHDP